LIVIASFVPGRTAIFSAPPEYGPAIPGPLIKNPKASLKPLSTHSQYSSEAKRKLNAT